MVAMHVLFALVIASRSEATNRSEHSRAAPIAKGHEGLPGLFPERTPGSVKAKARTRQTLITHDGYATTTNHTTQHKHEHLERSWKCQAEEGTNGRTETRWKSLLNYFAKKKNKMNEFNDEKLLFGAFSSSQPTTTLMVRTRARPLPRCPPRTRSSRTARVPHLIPSRLR